MTESLSDKAADYIVEHLMQVVLNLVHTNQLDELRTLLWYQYGFEGMPDDEIIKQATELGFSPQV